MSKTDRLYWISLDQSSIPQDYGWLSSAEKEILSTFRFTKRRYDWLLGRWTAKQLILGLSDNEIDANDISILPDANGAPDVYVFGKKSDISISISHSHGKSFCVASKTKIKIGCDLEKIEERTPFFINDFFTEGERAQLSKFDKHDFDTCANVFWCAKEALLKALRLGLRRDTRTLEVQLPHPHIFNTWHGLIVNDLENKLNWKLRYRVLDGYTLVVVVEDEVVLEQIGLRE